MTEQSATPPKMLVLCSWFLLLAAAAYQIAVVAAPVEFLVERVTVDDTFLYLQIARNWAERGFPTFDGEHPTSGFQPLWNVALLALARWIADRETLLRAALLLSAALNLFTGPLVLCLGQRMANASVGYLAMMGWSLYLFCPRSPNGMESALHGVIFASGALVALPAWTDWRQMTPRRWLLLGFLLGLNGLCRLDSGIVSALVATLFACRLIPARKWRELASICFLPVLMVGAYFAVNQLYFGSPTPISGRVKTHWAYAAPEVSASYVIATTATGAIRSFCHSLMYVSGGGEAYSYPWLPILLVMAVWSLACAWRKGLLDRRLLGWGALLFIHTLVVHALLLHLGKSYWYYQPLRVWAALVLGHFAIWYLPGLPRLSAALRVALVLFVCGFGVVRGVSILAHGSADLPAEKMSTEARALAMARWISNSPAASAEKLRIGSWNAGLLGYFASSHQVEVFNLDGLVQSDQFFNQVIRRQAWREYLREHGIHYLLDLNHQDATQTFQQKWDRQRLFRGLVPFDQAHVVQQMGPLYLLDVRPWLEDELHRPGPGSGAE